MTDDQKAPRIKVDLNWIDDIGVLALSDLDLKVGDRVVAVFEDEEYPLFVHRVRGREVSLLTEAPDV